MAIKAWDVRLYSGTNNDQTVNGIQSYLRSVKGSSRVLTEILSASLVPRPIAALSSLGMGLCVHRHTELENGIPGNRQQLESEKPDRVNLKLHRSYQGHFLLRFTTTVGT